MRTIHAYVRKTDYCPLEAVLRAFREEGFDNAMPDEDGGIVYRISRSARFLKRADKDDADIIVVIRGGGRRYYKYL